jgi:hypothetical protein
MPTMEKKTMSWGEACLEDRGDPRLSCRVLAITGDRQCAHFHPPPRLPAASTPDRQGHIRLGEVFASPHAAGALIQSRLAGLILGQSPLEYGRLWEMMLNTVGYDRRGVAMMAISAIDMALHDIAARARHVSVRVAPPPSVRRRARDDSLAGSRRLATRSW